MVGIGGMKKPLAGERVVVGIGEYEKTACPAAKQSKRFCFSRVARVL